LKNSPISENFLKFFGFGKNSLYIGGMLAFLPGKENPVWHFCPDVVNFASRITKMANFVRSIRAKWVVFFAGW
jgi:hypothetical protein